MWESPQNYSLTPFEREWLIDDSSLTHKLTCLSNNHFQVKIYNEFFCDHLDDFFLTDTLNDAPFFMREVILSGNSTPWVFACSIIPQRTAKAHPALLDLGNTSLGNYLFRHHTLSRDAIKISRLNNQHAMHQTAARALNQSLPDLWARCAVFWLDDKPLLVAEAFLPDFWITAAE